MLLLTLALTESNILLDTGAGVNLVFVDTLDNLPSNVSIDGTFKSKKEYHVSAAFGAKMKCSYIAKLQIVFPIFCPAASVPTVVDYFLIIPMKGISKIIFGKPLLRKLSYETTTDADYLTIDGTKVSFANSHANNLKLLQLDINVSNDLHNKFVKQFPTLFSDTVTSAPPHDFKYQVKLRDFDYHKPTPFFANTIQSKSIKN